MTEPHEADDRERTAALLASVRASIQAERAAREEATAEPPAGLAELLRPPGTPRRRRAQLQREWEARGAARQAASTRTARAAAEAQQAWGASSFADVLADRGYRAPRPTRAVSPVASPPRVRRPAPADAFAGESLEATLASGRGRSRRRPGSNETRPQPAPSPVRHSHELSEDGPGLAHRPAASYDWGGGLADVLRPVGPAPRRLAPTEPLPPRRRAPASPVESSDAAWGGGLADVLRPGGSAPRRMTATEPLPRRRAPASPVEVVDTWGGGLADVLPARGRATTRRRPPPQRQSPPPPPCRRSPSPPPQPEPPSPSGNADAMLAAQLGMEEAARAGPAEPRPAPRRATERARAEAAFAGGLADALPPRQERRRAGPDPAYAPVRRPRNVVAAGSLGDAFPARAAPAPQPRYPPPPRPSERAVAQTARPRPEPRSVLAGLALLGGALPANFSQADALPDSALTYDALLALDRPPEPSQAQRRAKKAAAARAVETTVHRKGAEPCECCICLDEFHDRERLAKLRCGHVFHSACIKKWLVHDLRCPTCRTDALGDDAPGG